MSTNIKADAPSGSNPPANPNPPPPSQRLRLCYSKKGDARYIGHLDVARFWERVFRRVNLPLAYSHGFNPQARIQFASALPVGIEGENELADVWLLERVQPEIWLDRIRATLPAGFVLHHLAEVPLELPAMQSSLRYALYEVQWHSSLSREELEGRVQALLAEPEVIRPHHKKQGKTYDLRPLIAELQVVSSPNGRPILRMKLHSGPQGNARAHEVISQLGLDDIPHTITRTGLILEESNETG